MAVTISTEPTYILPGQEAQITATASVGNWVSVLLTSAPTASKYQKQLDEEDASEKQLWAAQSGKKHDFTFDVAGRYVCTLREITKAGVNFGGGYAGDPDGWQTETVVGETSYSFVVGQAMTGEIRVGSESGTLKLYVWDSTIRATTVPSHGEVTPRIDANTEKMKIAVSSTGVVSALSALDGVAATTAITSLDNSLDSIISNFNGHRTQAGVHSANDTDNAIDTDYAGASNTGGVIETFTRTVSKLRYHFTNDAAGTGVGTGAYHSAGDWNNLPAVTGASDTLTAGIGIAALWHAYESHRVNATIHSAADTTNSCADLPPLLDVWRNVIAVVTNESPTAPSTDNPGAVVLVHRAGLTKA